MPCLFQGRVSRHETQALARMDDKPGRKPARPRNRISRPRTKTPPPEPEAAPDPPPNREPPHDGFDRWLDRSLHRLFDKVASEPVPDDLMKLLDEPGRSPRSRDKGPKGSD